MRNYLFSVGKNSTFIYWQYSSFPKSKLQIMKVLFLWCPLQSKSVKILSFSSFLVAQPNPIPFMRPLYIKWALNSSFYLPSRCITIIASQNLKTVFGCILFSWQKLGLQKLLINSFANADDTPIMTRPGNIMVFLPLSTIKGNLCCSRKNTFHL